MPETFEDRLARARANQERRDARAAQERAEAELARLELVDKLETEIGREGRDFAVIDVSDLGLGLIAVKIGEGVQWKTYASSKMNVVDTEAFVLPCVVHPSKEEYREIVAKRGFVADRCATALARLYGVRAESDQKK